MATSDLDPPVPSVSFLCPTCGATVQGGTECRRCHSDVHLLQDVLAWRATLLHAVAQALAAGHWQDALQLTQAVHQLRQDAESFRLLAVCQLLNEQPGGACETYRQYCSTTHNQA